MVLIWNMSVHGLALLITMDTPPSDIFQNLPQVNLHGLDEGLTLKMCVGILKATIVEATALHEMNATSVSNVTQI